MAVVQRRPKIANGVSARWIDEVAVPYRGDECLIWPFYKNQLGRPVLRVNSIPTYACRVVCEKVHGPPPSDQHVAAHSCGQGHSGCISPHHLRWATRKENGADMVNHGRSARGAAHHNHVLTPTDVAVIKAEIESGTARLELAKRFGVSKDAIHAIAQGRNWSWL